MATVTGIEEILRELNANNKPERKDYLFKKAREYSLECGAYVYLAIKIKKNGRIFTFNSDSIGEWPLPEA